MFGNPEVKKHKPNPVKGKRYLAFTLIMVVILSITVIFNSKNTTLESIARSNVANDSKIPTLGQKTKSTTESKSSTKTSSTDSGSKKTEDKKAASTQTDASKKTSADKTSDKSKTTSNT